MEIMRVPSGELPARTNPDKLDVPMIHSFLSNDSRWARGTLSIPSPEKPKKT